MSLIDGLMQTPIVDEESLSCIKPIFSKSGSHLFLKLFDSEDWSVEISLEMIEMTDSKLNQSSLLKKAIKKMMYQSIPRIGKKTRTTIMNMDFSRTTRFPFGNSMRNMFAQDQLIKIIVGKPKCGKTTLLKQYLAFEPSYRCFWLDFNGDRCDFSQLIYKLVYVEQTETVRIILDNLECCGLENGNSIFNVFSSLVREIQSKGTDIQLFVLIDSNRQMFRDYSNGMVINLSKERTLQECLGDTSVGLSDYHFLKRFDGVQRVKEQFDALEDVKQKQIVFNICVLIGCGIVPKITEKNDKKLLEDLIEEDKCEGLKLFWDDTVTFFDQEFCKLFMLHVEEAWNGGALIGVNEDFLKYTSNVFKNYNKEHDISDTELIDIFSSNRSSYYNLPRAELISILQIAQELKKDIEDKILIKGENEGYFNNHMGAILFAGETLSNSADYDWNALLAWKKLADYVRGNFFIGGQRLPEVYAGKEDATYYDFDKKDDNKNSIRVQIELQNEVLKKYHSSLNDISYLSEFSDRTLSYCLSEFQLKKIEIDDYERFYRTYILALLFEFEVTAPKDLIDSNRVEKLFEFIQINAQREASVNNKKELVYFYPARVPWVTARMLLALCAYKDRKHSKEVNALKNGMSNYLNEICINVRSRSNEYAVWMAGTGRWNSVLETTMMCTFALIRAGQMNQNTEKGINYINSQRGKWFKKDNIADGIWAYETICCANNASKNADRIKEIHKYIKETFDISADPIIEQIKKNDKSLGDSHIANSLCSLVNEFIGLIRTQYLIQESPFDTEDYVKMDSRKKFRDIDLVDNLGELTTKPSVFISYNTAASDYVDEIHEKIKKEALVIRFTNDDETGVRTWGSFHEFMKSIKYQDFAVLVISKAYLESEACMFEVMELWNEYENWDDKVMYVVLGDANVYEDVGRLKYVKYWQQKVKELDEATEGIETVNIPGIPERIRNLQWTASHINEFLLKVADSNNPSVDTVADKILERIQIKETVKSFKNVTDHLAEGSLTQVEFKEIMNSLSQNENLINEVLLEVCKGQEDLKELINGINDKSAFEQLEAIGSNTSNIITIVHALGSLTRSLENNPSILFNLSEIIKNAF